jgi:acyl-CoA synthetase (AMP-forming)/AMP-acid ligase II
LWLLGRCSARINDAQGVLYPFTVESVAQEQPGVRRAALVTEDGRRLLAIERDINFNPATMRTLQEALAWAHVTDIRSFASLPVDKRHNAKIDYPALRALLAR